MYPSHRKEVGAMKPKVRSYLAKAYNAIKFVKAILAIIKNLRDLFF